MKQKNLLSILVVPILLGLALAIGIFLGSKLNRPQTVAQGNKISTILNYIQQKYVDTVNMDDLNDRSIEKILEQLDPHSAYIPKEDLQSTNESLEGNFEGIGIEFHIQNDTIMVVSVIPGGPGEKVGLMAGDRIVLVDNKKAFGKDITNEKVFKFLRGKGGSIVNVSILRRNIAGLIKFKIVRDKIPLYSIDYHYIIQPEIGYIKINRFSATTYDEFIQSMNDLLKKGMKKLILDLRGNPGGYLDAATAICDEFIEGRQLLVYTLGKSRPRMDYYSSKPGNFEKGKIVVLIDEGSASASEIVSGALQDWDRATIIGRRSFGKGLVQEQTPFPDGSAVRLTIARYYTPTGRSIQKSYQNGYEDYEDELYQRIKHGELISKDSIHFADSLKYKTPAGKIVYGGGGIMPDIFVPIDTTHDSQYLTQLFALGIINQFAYDFVDKNRNILNTYKNAKEFSTSYKLSESIFNQLIDYASSNGLKADNKAIEKSKPLIKNQLLAIVARLKWQNEGLYQMIHQQDITIKKALETLK